jgi:hypothetical protein
MTLSRLLALLAIVGALFAPLPLWADSGSSLSGGGGGGGGGGAVQITSPLGSGTAPASAVSVSCVFGCAGGSSSNATSGVATSSTNLGVISYNYGFNGTTWDQLLVDANKSLITVLKQGSGVISATNGLYSNLLQGNAVISATNGLYTNILQGNVAIGATNGLYVLPTTAATWAATQSGSWTVSSNLVQIGGSSVSSAATGIQKVGIVGSAGAVFDGVASGATSPANVLQVGGVYNSGAQTPTTGWLFPLQLDAAGALLVNVKTTVTPNVAITSPLGTATTGANAVTTVFASGYTLPSFTSAQHTICDSWCSGTSSSFAAAFPASGLAIGAQYLSGSITQALTTAQMNSLYETVNGSLIVAPAVAVSSARSLSANIGYALAVDSTLDALRVDVVGGQALSSAPGTAPASGNTVQNQGCGPDGTAYANCLALPIAGQALTAARTLTTAQWYSPRIWVATDALAEDLSSIAGTVTATAAAGVQKVGITGSANNALDTAAGTLGTRTVNIQGCAGGITASTYTGCQPVPVQTSTQLVPPTTVPPTITTASYVAGNAVGATQTFPVFRNAVQPSGSLQSIAIISSSTNFNAVTFYVYLFTQSPSSTCTNASAFVWSASDLTRMVPGSPFQVVLAESNVNSQTTPVTGYITGLNIPVSSSSGTVNLYACFTTNTAVTGVVGALDYRLGIQQD